jgi:hypothetical protein
VPRDKHFILKDGRVVKNLLDLARALREMKPEIFEYHVNRDKNDFSEWIRHVVKDEILADNVARLIMKDKIEILLLRRILEKGEVVSNDELGEIN